MKIAFLGFDQYQGRTNIGSSRIRCDWPINYWPEAERFVMGKKYDAVIFQKAYWIQYAKNYDGVKILDLCDPDWMEPNSRVVEMINEVDAITTSSAALAEHVKLFTDKPVYYIPDRIDLNLHRKKKEHTERLRTVVWFGYNHNYPALDSAIKPLCDLGLELIVISNKPYHPPQAFVQKLDLTNIGYDPTRINDDLLRGDVVINPKLSSGRFKFKSNNKTLKAWALGLPVAESDRELKAFMDPAVRKTEVDKRVAEVAGMWDVKESVLQYKEIIEYVKSI